MKPSFGRPLDSKESVVKGLVASDQSDQETTPEKACPPTDAEFTPNLRRDQIWVRILQEQLTWIRRGVGSQTTIIATATILW